MNDRALRSIVNSLGGVANGYPREDGFDITVASEVMAILCLCHRISRISRRGSAHHRRLHARQAAGAGPRHQGGRRHDGAAQGRADAEPGADAREQPRLHPRRPVRQHRARLQLGASPPSARSRLATSWSRKRASARTSALRSSSTSCRKAGLAPSAAVIVATVRALKMHGGVAQGRSQGNENVAAVAQGLR